jgi:hypothetical protein
VQRCAPTAPRHTLPWLRVRSVEGLALGVPLKAHEKVPAPPHGGDSASAAANPLR